MYDKNTDGTPQVSCVRKQSSPVRSWGHLEDLGPSSSHLHTPATTSGTEEIVAENVYFLLVTFIHVGGVHFDGFALKQRFEKLLPACRVVHMQLFLFFSSLSYNKAAKVSTTCIHVKQIRACACFCVRCENPGRLDLLQLSTGNSLKGTSTEGKRLFSANVSQLTDWMQVAEVHAVTPSIARLKCNLIHAAAVTQTPSFSLDSSLPQ